MIVLMDRKERYAKLIKSIDSQTVISLSLRRDSPDRIKESNAANACGEFSDVNMADVSPENVSKPQNQPEPTPIKDNNTVHKIQSRFAQRYGNIAKIQGRVTQPAKNLNNTKLEPLFQPLFHQAEYRQVGNFQGYLL